MWVNGIQYDPQKMDDLLDPGPPEARERRLVRSFRDMGLTSAEAIKLLSHPSIFEANTKAGSQRYDWRDASEGGDAHLSGSTTMRKTAGTRIGQRICSQYVATLCPTPLNNL